MELIEHEPLHHAHFETKEHQTIFTAYYNTKTPEKRVRVYFEVSQLKARYAAHVVKTDNICVRKPWGGWELDLNDPDGNTVILYERNAPENIPPWSKA